MESARLPGMPSPGIVRTAAVVRAVPDHGTRARYLHRSLACRCRACTDANTAYQQVYRARIARAATWTPRQWTQPRLPGH